MNSHDENQLATFDIEPDEIILWDRASGVRLYSIPTPRQGIVFIEFDDSIENLYLLSHTSCSIWSLHEKRIIKEIQFQSKIPGSILTDFPRNRIFGRNEMGIQVIDLITGKVVSTYQDPIPTQLRFAKSLA